MGRKPVPRVERNCETCGTVFMVSPGNKKQARRRFCSRECAWEFERGPKAVCRWCGKEYQPKHSRYRTCCSQECGYKWAHAVRETDPIKRIKTALKATQTEAHHIGICQMCGCHFRGQNVAERYCSSECRRGARSVRKGSDLSTHYRKCAVCGEWFATRRPRQTKCSNTCRSADERRAKLVRLNMVGASHIKRASHYGVPFENGITWRTAVKRFGAVCAICGDTIDTTLAWDATRPDPGYPTLDHIVPLSRGGGHTWDNVQVAHHYCNCAAKRDLAHDEVAC